MKYRTALGNVKGLGSSHSGSKEWLIQKILAIVLAILFIWFTFSFAYLIKSDTNSVYKWFTSPVNGVLLILFFTTAFYHAALGLQTVIEDYVPETAKRIAYIYIMKIALGIVWLLLTSAIIKLIVFIAGASV